MKISFNNFQKLYENKKADIDALVARVFHSGRFILGPEVEQFEKSFALYNTSTHAIGVANGLEALQIALLGLGIGPGDEVITTPHSAVATTLSIVAVGAKPVFVDIDEFFHIDAEKIEAAITKKTRAIIPVHLYGQSADMKTIMSIAKKHDLAVVEDCAQAHGAQFDGQKVGTIGNAGCFSFYPTKNLGAFGDAGAIVTNDAALAEKCRMMRNYGQKNRYEHAVYGINSRLDEVQAAILSLLLPELDSRNKRRKEIAEIYIAELRGVGDITLPQTRKGNDHVFHLFVIETTKRDELQQYLKENDIDSLIHYPIPIHKQTCFGEYNKLSLPIVENKAKKILSLPIHPFLTDEEVRFVSTNVKNFFTSK